MSGESTKEGARRQVNTDALQCNHGREWNRLAGRLMLVILSTTTAAAGGREKRKKGEGWQVRQVGG